MNNSLFGQAQDAYEAGDFSAALDYFNATLSDNSFPLEPGEMGLLYHQIGNCLVKLKCYDDAISAYVSATTDNSYNSTGTVYYNLGMAYSYLNDFSNAVANFQIAVNDPGYNSKYKAYTAMGNALMKSGKSPEAGAVFRAAAMDPNNPDPTRALLNLGVCFMALGRPSDAVIAYESAFQFEMNSFIKNRLHANLGQAYVATGQMSKAVNSFEESLKDKSYVLSDSASVDYQRAVESVGKGKDNIDVGGGQVDLGGEDLAAASAAAGGAGLAGSPTDSGAAYGAQPENPMSESVGVASEAVSNLQNLDAAPLPGGGDVFQENGPQLRGSHQETFDSISPINPSADTQFSGNDADFEAWTQSTKEAAYNKQTKRSGVKIFLIILLVVVILAIGSAIFLWFRGYGIPSQEMIINRTFENPLDSRNEVYANGVSDVKKSQYSSMVSQMTEPQIKAIERSATESLGHVSAKTTAGGEVTYKFKMVRDMVGWKISSIDLEFASQNK